MLSECSSSSSSSSSTVQSQLAFYLASTIICYFYIYLEMVVIRDCDCYPDLGIWFIVTEKGVIFFFPNLFTA